jgi:hypothetical protein
MFGVATKGCDAEDRRRVLRSTTANHEFCLNRPTIHRTATLRPQSPSRRDLYLIDRTDPTVTTVITVATTVATTDPLESLQPRAAPGRLESSTTPPPRPPQPPLRPPPRNRAPAHDAVAADQDRAPYRRRSPPSRPAALPTSKRALGFWRSTGPCVPTAASSSPLRS